MKIRALATLRGDHGTFKRGAVVDVPDHYGRDLVKRHRAELAEDGMVDDVTSLSAPSSIPDGWRELPHQKRMALARKLGGDRSLKLTAADEFIAAEETRRAEIPSE